MALPAGNYELSGGDATSGNGDVGFSSNDNEYGGLNYKTGVSPWLILAAVVAAVLVVKGV